MTNPPDVPAPQPPAGPGPLAEWADRVIATLIDFVFVFAAGIVVFIVGVILGAISDVLGTLVSSLGYLALSIYALYLGYLEGIRGQSPGKAIRGLKVVNQANGELIGGGMGVVRKLAHVIDSIICYIGYLFPLWDPQKQTIADKLLQTVVLKDQEHKPLSAEIFMP
ncbi:MAG: RDD family protein [Acidimicrobiia bacterium]